MTDTSSLSRVRASLILLLVAFIWGTTFVAQKTAFETTSGPALGPLTFTGLRFLLGALVVLPFALRERQSGGGTPMPTATLGVFALLGALLFVASMTQQVGILQTSVTNAGFLTALYVPLVPVIALAVFRQPVRRTVWVGALGCVAGTWFLTGGLAGASLNTGDLWVMLSALFWAMHVMSVGILVVRSRRPVTLALVQFLACGVLSLIGAFLVETPSWPVIAGAWGEILYAGVLSVGVAYTLQVVAQRHTPAAAAALIMSTETVFAALSGAVVLGERLSMVQGVGAALILASILVVELGAALGARRAALR
ncbi:DMT family transporter [Pararhodospirillum photometricum]|nr:DMT family transporter [Pararhodospirillum photometricum]